MDDKPGAGTPDDSEESRPAPTSLLRRLFSWHWVAFTLVVVLAVAAFLFLAWWQLGRFESRTGDWQNFGYALQWPFFAVFAIYVWWRLLRDSRRESAEHEAADGRAGPGPDDRREADRRTGDELAELPPLPPKRLVRPDGAVARSAAGGDVADPAEVEDGTDEAALTAYNRYLAALQERSTAAGLPAGHSDGRPPG
ncbi:hypothetical protein [Actinopolymorpha rutila]|uniref:DNA-binding transcriptional regulator of glucitol operon n=1 Tax=Actinopolymorpha rutila TaxID=446787 RepID=A0A852Z9R8_9ACTN|nr:hypothetical protein [Actinopolymorpha rutila]NYH88955.1 hypothetical protein [Actinopolymorpha rutila]